MLSSIFFALCINKEKEIVKWGGLFGSFIFAVDRWVVSAGQGELGALENALELTSPFPIRI
jgi:hypothetical protein